MLLIQSAPSNPLNDATWLFPLLECWHILGFALSVGTIAIIDFRLLGFGMLRQTPAELAKDFAPWTLVRAGQHAAIRSADVCHRPGYVLPESSFPGQNGLPAAGHRDSLHSSPQGDFERNGGQRNRLRLACIVGLRARRRNLHRVFCLKAIYVSAHLCAMDSTDGLFHLRPVVNIFLPDCSLSSHVRHRDVRRDDPAGRPAHFGRA